MLVARASHSTETHGYRPADSHDGLCATRPSDVMQRNAQPINNLAARVPSEVVVT